MDGLKENFINKVASFIDYLSKHLPDDAVARLKEMSEAESVPRAKVMYECMLRNLRLADETDRPVCQDTGLIPGGVSERSRLPRLFVRASET